ncbi:MAG: hypothetical protein ABSH19_05455 [Opitutales bacterium]
MFLPLVPNPKPTRQIGIAPPAGSGQRGSPILPSGFFIMSRGRFYNYFWPFKNLHRPQPGVRVSKKSGGRLLAEQNGIQALRAASWQGGKLGLEPQVELIFKLLQHMTAKSEKGVRKIAVPFISDDAYSFQAG